MKLDQFDFDLPPECIAHKPAIPRESAKLLHVPAANDFGDRHIRELPSLLQKGDLLVFNNTKVIPAEFTAYREDILGGKPKAIIMTLHRLYDAKQAWCFCKGIKKLKDDTELRLENGKALRVVTRDEQHGVLLEFLDDHVLPSLEAVGRMPLPPYIERPKEGRKEDFKNYQTIFAQKEGAVAAPTAGLHFTEAMFQKLAAMGVQKTFVTLHVGAGTFLPVKTDDIRDHRMHAEWGMIDKEAAEQINQAKAEGRRVIPIGTTSLRILESAAKANGPVQNFEGETDIFIYPGYQFKVPDLLFTNFHLPKSTLFMLVSAFAGLDRMQDAYRHAIQNDYRFFSYGDACLLEKAK